MSLPRYQQYKDSGVEWIGEIPEGWEVKRFSRISYMKGRIGWQGLKQAEFTSNPDDPYLITGMNFKDGLIDWPEVYHIREERYEEAPDIQLKDNDVLITKDGTIGKLLFIDKIPYPHKASLNSHLLVLRPLDHEYHSKYLFYQLQSIIFKHHVEITKTGTTFFGITQEAMGQYNALLPLLSEQTAIVSFLDRKTAEIDQLIANKDKLISLYEEEKTAIINRAVTRGLDPSVTTKPSGVDWLGDIPEHWEVKRIKYLFNNLDYRRIPLSGEERGRMLIKEYDYYGASGVIDQVEDYIFDGEYILIGEDGANLLTRSTALAFKATGKYWVNNHAHILEPMIGPIDFWVNYLESLDYRIWVSGSAQPKLTAEALANIDVAVPPVSEQTDILAHIETECSRLDTIIDKFKKQIELFKEYRTILISEVVTGKIDVRDEVAA